MKLANKPVILPPELAKIRMVLDQIVLHLGDIQLLAENSEESPLRRVDLQIVAARLVQHSAVDAKLIVAFEHFAGVDCLADPCGLGEHDIAKPRCRELECRRVEQQSHDRERRGLTVEQELLEEAIAPEHALDGGEQLWPWEVILGSRVLVGQPLEVVGLLSASRSANLIVVPRRICGRESAARASR